MAMRRRLKEIAPTTTFTVKADHIAHAVRKDSHHCMIADAIACSVKGAQYISVDRRTVRFSDAEKRYIYVTPAASGDALTAFDAGRPVKPFRCRLIDGFTMPRGWQAKHPHSTRKGQKPKKRTRERRGLPVGLKRTRLDGYQQVSS